MTLGKFKIYKATNKINGKSYVGQTVKDLRRRILDHVSNANNGSLLYFHCALKKYEPKNFVWEILCYCKNLEDANKFERYYINKFDTFKNGYNLTTGGHSNIFRPEVLEKLSGENSHQYVKIEDSKIKEIIKLFLGGFKKEEISRQTGITINLVKRVLADNIEDKKSAIKVREENYKKLKESKVNEKIKTFNKLCLYCSGEIDYSEYTLEYVKKYTLSAVREKNFCGLSCRGFNNNNKTACFLTYGNKTLSKKGWARELGINDKTLDFWFKKGLPLEDIVKKFTEKGKKEILLLAYKGKEYSMTNLAKKLKIDRNRFSKLLKEGSTLKEAINQIKK